MIHLTPSQRDILVAASTNDGSAASGNDSLLIDISGPLSYSDLKDALARVVARHPLLRANISNDGTVACVQSSAMIDFATGAAFSGVERLLTEIKSAAAVPFDFPRGPLVRMRVLPLDRQRTLVMLVLPRLIADEQAFATVVREWVSAYDGSQWSPDEQTPLNWADAPGWIQPLDEDAAARYWQDIFQDGVPAAPRLFPRQAGASVPSSRHQLFELSEVTVSGIAAAVETLHATPFMILLALYCAWLHRLGGCDDLVVAIPGSIRTMDAAEVVCHAAVTLPIRSKLAPGEPFCDLVERIRDHVLDAMETPPPGIGWLGRLLHVDPSLASSPLNRIAFNLDCISAQGGFRSTETRFTDLNAPFVSLDLDDFDGGRILVGNPVPRCDLTFVVDRGEKWKGVLETRADIFSATDLDRLAQSLQEFMRLVLDQPGVDLGQFPIKTLP